MLQTAARLLRGKGREVELDDDDKRVLSGLVDTLQQFADMRANIPLHQVIMLLRLAMEEGKSQKHYSVKWDLPPSTVSRAMLDLGKRTRKGEEGLGLVQEQHAPHSLKEHEVYLSPKGRGLITKIIKRLCK
jgi:DNA-binding MarR family transcriptional regulator